MEPINTEIIVADLPPGSNKKVANITLLDAKFWGRPNFSGEEDRFKDSRRKFTVLIPNEHADLLRNLGWNVRTLIPTPEQLQEDPTREPISSLKVMLNFGTSRDGLATETGPDVFVKLGNDGDPEKLNSKTVGLLDRSHILEMGMEIRAWEYDPEDDPGKYSARLVQLIAVIQPSMLEQRFGNLR